MRCFIVRSAKSEISPILKWVGGKRQLLNALSPLFPKDYDVYCEPFLGGGAVLFYLKPNKAIVNDVNGDIMNLYQVVKTDVEALIVKLKTFKNTSDCYYQVREWDRDKILYESMDPVARAARILFMNRTCFNGVYRVNSKGFFNVPYGRYKNPIIADEVNLRAVSQYFNEADIEFCSGDYADVFANLPQNSFVYLDPPYDPVSDTANFTGYAKGGFSREDQIRLRGCCDGLNARGIKFMQSNAATPFIMELYHDYNITMVKANRSINRNGDGRGAVDEVVIRNYVNDDESFDDEACTVSVPVSLSTFRALVDKADLAGLSVSDTISDLVKHC